MAEDFDALVADLTTNSRYDPTMVSGNNGATQTLLNETDVLATFVFDDVPVADVLEAAGQVKLKALVPADRARLLILVSGGSPGSQTVATSKDAVREELLDIFGITEVQLAAGVPAVRRRPTFGEAFGYKNVSLDTVRQAVRLIAKSFIVSSGQV